MLSETSWFPLNGESRVDHLIKIQRTELEFDDNYWNIAGLFTIFDAGFQLLKMPTRTIPYDNTMLTTITFEMFLSKRIYYRSVYSSLDFISDIGGLFGAVSPLVMGFLTIMNFYAGYQFLLNDLFIKSDRQSKVGGTTIDAGM